MGPIFLTETAIMNYHYWVCNDPEERSYHLLRDGTPHSHNAMLVRTHGGTDRVQNLDKYRKVILRLILRKWVGHSSYIYSTSGHSDWLFVVSQVDGEGYVRNESYINAVKNMYPEDSLKTLVESVAPGCIADANVNAKGKYKAKKM